MQTEGIDYRKDTPPVDWLSKRVAALRAQRPNPPSLKHLGHEFMRDLMEELDALRCQEPCPSQNGAVTVADGTAATSATATSQSGADPVAATASTLLCICGLIDRISDLTGEWVPKDEFVAVLQPFGYTKDKALKKYSIYALKKIKTKYRDEFERLEQEAENAYNWAWDGSHEAGKALEDALAEQDELQARCKAELAEFMAE